MGKSVLDNTGGPNEITWSFTAKEMRQCQKLSEVLRCHPAGFEDGGNDHKATDVDGFWKLGKLRKQTPLLWSLQKEN